MRKAMWKVILAVFIIMLMGCGASKETATQTEDSSASKTEEKETETKAEETASEVEEDQSEKKIVEDYIEQIKPVVEDLQIFAQDFEELKSQSINGEITDEEFAQTISDTLLPTNIEMQTTVQQMLPEKEVRDVHEKLIGMVSKNAQALTEIISAIDTGDTSKITSANALLAEATKIERDFIYDLQDLAEKNNLSFE